MNNSEAPALSLLQPYVTLTQLLLAPLLGRIVQEKHFHALPVQKQTIFKSAPASRMVLSLYASDVNH